VRDSTSRAFAPTSCLQNNAKNRRIHCKSNESTDELVFPYRTERLLLCFWCSRYSVFSISLIGCSPTERSRPTMVTVKSSQKIFTDFEVATLTGICVDHLHNFAKSRHLGFIARAAEAASMTADQWLFTLSDLMVLVTLFPRCTH
jgi:hypothetical protein